MKEIVLIRIDYEKLKETAKKLRFSEGAVAKAVGISSSMVNVIFSGKNEPTATKLKKICDVLEIPIQDVFITDTYELKETQTKTQAA